MRRSMRRESRAARAFTLSRPDQLGGRASDAHASSDSRTLLEIDFLTQIAGKGRDDAPSALRKSRCTGCAPLIFGAAASRCSATLCVPIRCRIALGPTSCWASPIADARPAIPRRREGRRASQRSRPRTPFSMASAKAFTRSIATGGSCCSTARRRATSRSRRTTWSAGSCGTPFRARARPASASCSSRRCKAARRCNRKPSRSSSGALDGLPAVSARRRPRRGFSRHHRRRKAEAQRDLLVGELEHRIKNTLSIVLSIAAQTFGQSGVDAAVRQAFEARLVALGNVHGVLTKRSWDSADLQEVVMMAIRPHSAPGGERFTVEGPMLRLGPKCTVALSMAVHELCTNAIKYGALSAEAGRVDITWEGRRRGACTGAGANAADRWCRAAARGFRLAHDRARACAQLAGRVTIDYRQAASSARSMRRWRRSGTGNDK